MTVVVKGTYTKAVRQGRALTYLCNMKTLWNFRGGVWVFSVSVTGCRNTGLRLYIPCRGHVERRES